MKRPMTFVGADRLFVIWHFRPEIDFVQFCMTYKNILKYYIVQFTLPNYPGEKHTDFNPNTNTPIQVLVSQTK